MASPILLAVAHTLVLSLLPMLFLQLFRLCRAANPVQSAVVASSTLCAGLYGVFALVALAGAGTDDGRIAAIAAGTLGCVAVLLLDVYIICAACVEKSYDTRRSRSGADNIALAVLLSLLVLASAAVHAVLLCLPSSDSTRLALSVGRAVSHVVFLTTAALLLVGRTWRTRSLRASGFDSSAHAANSTAGARYAQDLGRPGAAMVGSPQAGLLCALCLGIALDIVSVCFPVRANFVALASGGTTTPTLFGATSTPVTYVVAATLAWARWAMSLSSATDSLSASPARFPHSSSADPQLRPVTPSPSTTPLGPHRSPGFNPDSTFSSWAHLTPSPLSMSRRPGTGLSAPMPVPGWTDGGVTTSSSSPVAGKTAEHPSSKAALRSSFLSLGTKHKSGAPRPVGSEVVDLEHPYLHSQTVPATYAPSISEDMDEPGRSEDLVVPPSPSPMPGGRRGRPISPSLPPPVSSGTAQSPFGHRAHHSLPPFLTSTPPSGPLASLYAANGSTGLSDAEHSRRTSRGLSGALPLLARKISQTFSPSSDLGSESPYRFPRNRPSLSVVTSPSPAPQDARSRVHASTDAPSSTYFSPLSSPQPTLLVRTSSSPTKLRLPSLARQTSTPDIASSGSLSPIPNSALSPPVGSRRRSGSVGSLLRNASAGAGPGGRGSTTPTPTHERGGMSWWDVEPNESEDDPFARSAPPSASSASLRDSRDSRLDLAEEAGAIKLRRALEAIQEPAMGSGENSAKTSAKFSSSADGKASDELERVLTCPPSPASVKQLHRQASGTSSKFREHLDGQWSTSALPFEMAEHPLPSPSSLPLDPPLVATNVGPRRKRTDQKATMSPSALAGARLREALEGEDSTPRLLFTATTGSHQAQVDNTAPFVPSSFGSPRSNGRWRRRPLNLPLAGTALASSASSPVTPVRRSPSFTFRSKRSVSSPSPSLLTASALALQKMRRRSPSPHSTSRISESSELSFACRGAMSSVSDLNAPIGSMPVAVAVDSSSDGGHAFEVVDAESTVQPRRGGGARRPWWNRLPGSRPPTPPFRTSVSPLVPHRTSAAASSIALGRSRSTSDGSSAALAARSSPDGYSSTPSHVRSISVPVLSGSNALRRSQVQLPPITDVSPFSSSIFHSRRSGSNDHPEPVPPLPASLAAQYVLAAPRSSFLSVESSPRALSLRSEIRHEDVVHELDDLIGSLAGPFLAQGSLSGSYEFPERSFSGASSVGIASSQDFDVLGDNEARGDDQYAEVVDSEPVSPSETRFSPASSATPTSSASLAPSTPYSPLFSPSSFEFDAASRPSVVSALEGSDAEELLSPLTPASGGWGSLSSTSGGGGAGCGAWREKVMGQDEWEELEVVQRG